MLKKLTLCIILTQAFIAHGKVYDFRELYNGLGYNSDKDLFGSTMSEQMSINTYLDKSDNFFSEINSYLRFHPAPYEWSGTSPTMAQSIVNDIDRVLSRAPRLPMDLMVFRGLTLNWRNNKSFAMGEEYVDKAYTSTSTSYKVAEHFAKGPSEDKTSKRALFALYFNRPQIKGLLIDQNEDEVLLPRDQKFRIMDLQVTDKYELYLVQVCSNKCEEIIKDNQIQLWWNNKETDVQIMKELKRSL